MGTASSFPHEKSKMQSAAFLPIPSRVFSPRSLSIEEVSRSVVVQQPEFVQVDVNRSQPSTATALTNLARYPSPQAVSSSTEAAAGEPGVGKRE